MQFVDSEPNEESVRAALIDGLIAMSVAVPLIVTELILYRSHHPFTSKWGLTALALTAATVVYAVVHIVLRARKGHVDLAPPVVFAVIGSQMVTIALVTVGAHASLAYYLPAMFIGIYVTCTIGDRSMRFGMLALVVALVAWSGWGEGLRGWHLATLVVMYAWTGGVLVLLLGHVMEGMVRVAHRQRGISRIAGMIGEADSVEEGLRLVLPMIERVLPTDHVILAARDDDGAVAAVDAWPAAEAGDTELVDRPELVECLERDVPVLVGETCFVRVGFTGTDQFVVVTRLRRRRGETRLHITETAANLAAVLLRLTSRVAFVTTLHTETRTDPLTGLTNRRGLIDRLESDMVRSVRNRLPLCVGMIDIDHFKLYNDTYGHVEGDHMLRSVTATMADTVRRQDLLVRYGGEEFVLVLPDTDLAGALQVAEKVRVGVMNAGGAQTMTVSIGVAVWDGLEEPMSLIGRADEALYQAKRNGRNQTVIQGNGTPVGA